MTSIFQSVQLAPRDPILGLNEQFNADSRPDKVNLGVGVYTDDNGRLPLLKAVSQAEMALAQEGSARGYLPIEGIPGYNQGVQQLLFGKEAAVITSGRAL
ncbi:MAG TPA: aminotransferase class I/II-fold pyridoxal phosphate-dependent enzyme, partial [Burkholderiaceae bacterium]|nr:aminotransferase class I/II-fold pyridoxal phosphate-dependent enzyme [Burkholderiaceae bacterium]